MMQDSSFFMDERRLVRQLTREHEHLCFQYRLRLSRPFFRIEEARSRWGFYDPVAHTIGLNRHLITQYPWHVVQEVLRHEMAHQVVHEMFRVPDASHGPLFQKACRLLGTSAWASASERDLWERIPDWRQEPLNDEQSRLQRKAEKLLSLATSSNEHEALLAMQRVRELYAKHQWDTAAATAAGAGTKHFYLIIPLGKRVIAQHESMVAHLLNRHFFVEVISAAQYDPRLDKDLKVFELMGTRENLLMAEYVYHFLMNNLAALWRAYVRETKAPGKAKRSFYLGVLTGFDETLARTTPREVRTTPGPSSRRQEVMALMHKAGLALAHYVAARHPRLGRRSWSAGAHDAASFSAGKTEGGKLTLHRAVAERGHERHLLK